MALEKCLQATCILRYLPDIAFFGLVNYRLLSEAPDRSPPSPVGSQAKCPALILDCSLHVLMGSIDRK